MSRGGLARTLSRLERFENAKLDLEQYATPGELAAELLWTARMAGDIENRSVVDLGAGTGVLGIGALSLGASRVAFIEIDPDAIRILRHNLEGFDADRCDVVQIDVSSFSGSFDTCVMNPPFGAQREHADRVFLDRATTLARRIYSIHNANSRSFLERYAREAGLRFSIIAARSLPLSAAFEHHRKPRVFQEVVLCRLER